MFKTKSARTTLSPGVSNIHLRCSSPGGVNDDSLPIWGFVRVIWEWFQVQAEDETLPLCFFHKITHRFRHRVVVNVFLCFKEVAVVQPPVRWVVSSRLVDSDHLNEVFATVNGLFKKGGDLTD